MPDHRFETAEGDPLFPDDDPLTLSVPGADGKWQKFLCLDRANPPLERDDTDPERRPVSYMVELLKLQVVEDERDAFEEAMIEAVKANRVMISELVKTARWVGDMREQAEKGTLARVVQRPTKARQRSTR